VIYALTTNVMVPGKMAENLEIHAKELIPLYQKLGMNLVGSFRYYTGNINQAFAIVAYNDLAAYQKMREVQQKDQDWQRVWAKLNALRVSSNVTLLEPNPWSPMK
jgi:hypothetical protein